MTHTDDFYADGQGAGQKSYKPSSHQFTDPIRLFKANDPYYWEVDNVPLQQLQEGMLWLKDQVGSDEVFDSIGRADFSELKPDATGATRDVKVSPGRFTGRVNDAYNTGISVLLLKTLASVDKNPLNEIEITTPNAVMQSLAGTLTTKILEDNGLYDFVQHNVTAPGALYNLQWTNNYTNFIQNKQTANGAVYDLQHIKLALWKQGTTVKNYGGDPNTEVDLQQLAVEFTRVYGAPFRTAVVDVPYELTITVPEFDDADYANHTTYVPAIRVDLLFVYTKPIDAASTTILKPNGTTVSQILTPQLGLVKGAGVIALNGKGNFDGIPIEKGFFTSPAFVDGRDVGSNYFESSGAFDSNMNMQTASVMGDLNQTSIGINNTFGNFPSPDDLLNAAPYITDGVSKTNLQLVGQSVLPIAYVFTKRGKVTIEKSDILDIRPFFRTAELTYNERAGLAAANPPTSLANPVVSKYQLADSTKKLRDYVLASQPTPPEYPRPVGSGYVFGGIRYGPEGVLARLDADQDAQSGNSPLTDLTTPTLITTHLKNTGLLPADIPGIIPQYPDWDTPPWAQSQKNSPGLLRNDRFFFYYNQANRPTYPLSQDGTFNTVYGGHVDYPQWVQSNDGYARRTGSQALLVRKRIDIDTTKVITWMKDYQVRLSLVNCALADSDAKFFNLSNNDDHADWMNPHGLYIEKYSDHFNIVCVWHNGDPYKGTIDSGPGGTKNVGAAPSTKRTNQQWSNVFVTNENGMIAQKEGSSKTADWLNMGSNPMFRGAWCTYPTVLFEVIGYPESYVSNIKMDTGTNSTISLTT
tara:strand:- start:463 stop:2886 length:2424 start_codon:yes stop_codon:yes gene_type:complete